MQAEKGRKFRNIKSVKEVKKMLRQKDMEYNMLKAHRQFISELEKSLDMLKDDINEVEGVSGECSDEWCKSREDHY